jgi:hypothetical protein
VIASEQLTRRTLHEVAEESVIAVDEQADLPSVEPRELLGYRFPLDERRSPYQWA